MKPDNTVIAAAVKPKGLLEAAITPGAHSLVEPEPALIPLTDGAVTTWVVVFQDHYDGNNRKWDFLTKKGFRHCYAMCMTDFGWLVVDPLSSWLEIHVIKEGKGDLIAQAKSDPLSSGLLVTRVMKRKYLPRYLPMTCVSVVKSLLGLKSRAFTPYGLYKHLMEDEHVQSIWGHGKA
jgi:hypothetical protein